MDKSIPSCEQAVADIRDGSTVMLGGFGAAGLALNLVHALIAKGARGLTVIANAIPEFFELVQARRISKVITSAVMLPKSAFPVNPFKEQYLAGEIELELLPEGTLPERIRAAGVGIAGFYSPVGVGTFVEKGKETKLINGKKYILEMPLHADFALIKGYKGDRFGNLVYRKTARNINPIMAMAAKVTIAEVEEIVEVGQLDPELIITPGIFVDRVVQAKKLARELTIKY